MVCTFGDATDVRGGASRARRCARSWAGTGACAEVELRKRAPFRVSTPTLPTEITPRSRARTSSRRAKRIVELLAEPGRQRHGATVAPLAGRARADRARGEVLREWRSPPRVRADPPVVRSAARQEGRSCSARANRFSGTRRSCTRATATGPKACRSTGAVSRQRYFGVPIPVWYPLDAEAGECDYANPIVRRADAAARRPDECDVPKGYEEAQRGQPGGFAGEADIFDTWFTSSHDAADRVALGALDAERHARLFPADMRPQSHEIIRTWAFYTIAKAMLHEDSIPVEARGDLGLDPRPRSQEDVEERRQRADAPCL